MFSSRKFLLTGTSTGAGKYFKRNIQTAATIRYHDWAARPDILNGVKADVVIHSAFDASFKVDNYGDYFKSNLEYTRSLLETEPNHFIFLSSAAVYDEENTNYKLSKLLCENMIKDYTDSHTIIRCSAILGPDMRPNSLTKILFGLEDRLTLAEDSTFNYVLQSDLLEFISACTNNNLFGTYDFVSNDSVSLQQVCSLFNKSISFGDYTHKSLDISNSNTKKVYSGVDKSSIDVILEYMDGINEEDSSVRG